MTEDDAPTSLGSVTPVTPDDPTVGSVQSVTSVTPVTDDPTTEVPDLTQAAPLLAWSVEEFDGEPNSL
jgi:hypothetical protein